MLANCAKICFLMIFSVLCNSPRVEHKKKRNDVDSKKKYVKRNANHQHCLIVCMCYSSTYIQ